MACTTAPCRFVEISGLAGDALWSRSPNWPGWLGGMAEIWKARVEGIEGFEKTVAIKRVQPNFEQDEGRSRVGVLVKDRNRVRLIG